MMQDGSRLAALHSEIISVRTFVMYLLLFYFVRITVWLYCALSVFWRCWLDSRKGIRPVKNWVVGCWHGCLSGARCRLGYGPAYATTTHCLLLQIGFTFLVPAHPGSPGGRAVKRVCTVWLSVHSGVFAAEMVWNGWNVSLFSYRSFCRAMLGRMFCINSCQIAFFSSNRFHFASFNCNFFTFICMAQ